MLSVLFVASLLQGVYSHGLLTSPAGRQYKASLDRGQTLQYEDCPHCMNRGGVCGVSQTDASKNYLYPKDNFGNVIVPTVDECYSPGQDIVLKFVLTAHHRGHIEVKLCPDHLNPTQACFDQYPLEFLEDQSYSERANKDSNHPDRGYLHPNNGRANPPDSLETPFGGGMPYTMRFKIPENIGQCDHCVLQWTYVTGNSCNAHGYRSYNFPSEDWWAPYLSDCPNPLPKEGLATSLPEQFWNCADVQISNTCGSATPSENENQDQDQDQDGDADADGDANAGGDVDEEEGRLDGPGVSLPCGGILDVLVERLLPYNATLEHLAALEATLTGQRPQLRHVDLASGRMRLENDSGLGERVLLPAGGDEPAPGEVQLRVGPVARLVLAGMSPVAEACAEFAVRLGFEVILCDPRPGMLAGVSLPGVERVEALPSSFIAAGGCHGATAIVALTHDPRIDDLAMIEAVRTEAFYIGVMGSQQTSAARAERLERSGGLSAAELARIQMPVGLRLGSKTPAEIALAVMADIVRVRRGRALADL